MPIFLCIPAWHNDLAFEQSSFYFYIVCDIFLFFYLFYAVFSSYFALQDKSQRAILFKFVKRYILHPGSFGARVYLRSYLI